MAQRLSAECAFNVRVMAISCSTHATFSVQDFKHGSIACLEFLYSQYFKSLSYFAGRLIIDGDTNEDVVADSFVKCWENRERFNSLKEVVSFLYMVTRNACYNHLRHQQVIKKSRIFFASSDKLFEDKIHTEMVRAESLRQILQEAESLPDKMKTVFNELFIEGESIAAVADKMGLSVNTVKAQRANALRKIKQGLAQRGIVGSWFF